jgi:hypothetical protein
MGMDNSVAMLIQDNIDEDMMSVTSKKTKIANEFFSQKSTAGK